MICSELLTSVTLWGDFRPVKGKTISGLGVRGRSSPVWNVGDIGLAHNCLALF